MCIRDSRRTGTKPLNAYSRHYGTRCCRRKRLRYDGGMFRTASCGLLLLVLLGACEAPQPATTVGPLPGQQTERFPNGDLYVGQMAGGLREGRGTYSPR